MKKSELRQIIREELEVALAEQPVNESAPEILQAIIDALGGTQMVNVGGEGVAKWIVSLVLLGSTLGIGGIGGLAAYKDKVSNAKQLLDKLPPDEKEKLKKEVSKK